MKFQLDSNEGTQLSMLPCQMADLSPRPHPFPMVCVAFRIHPNPVTVKIFSTPLTQCTEDFNIPSTGNTVVAFTMSHSSFNDINVSGQSRYDLGCVVKLQNKTRKATPPMKSRMKPQPGDQNIFGIMWPWPPDKPKVTVSCPCPVDHLVVVVVVSGMQL